MRSGKSAGVAPALSTAAAAGVKSHSHGLVASRTTSSWRSRKAASTALVSWSGLQSRSASAGCVVLRATEKAWYATASKSPWAPSVHEQIESSDITYDDLRVRLAGSEKFH